MSDRRAQFGLVGLLLLVRRSLRQHWVSTLVTAVAIGLGCGLVMAVFAIQQQAERAFTGNSIGYDAVLGARGSKLQLVLSSVFHVEQSPGNVSWDAYQEVANHPLVELAVPQAMGDNYRGFRLVGTTTQQFTDYRDSDGGKLLFASGVPFEENSYGAVLGSFAAERTGLKVGDTFQAFHGLSSDASQQHTDTFTVTGVLGGTNSPLDRVIWVPLKTVFHMEGHVLRGAGEIYEPRIETDGHEGHDHHDHGQDDDEVDDDHDAHDDHAGHAHDTDEAPAEDDHEGHAGHDHDAHAGHDHGGEEVDGEVAFGVPVAHLEFSAILIKLRGPQAGFYFDEIFNRRGKEATFAWPISTVTTEFFAKLGWMTLVLRQIAYLVVLIAAATILASIYNTINERRRQFAILRALGARRLAVFAAVIGECKAIATIGALLGWGVYLAIFSVASGILRREVGIVLDPLAYHPVLWAAPLGVIVLGTLVGIVPAWKAYATDVASNLVPRT